MSSMESEKNHTSADQSDLVRGTKPNASSSPALDGDSETPDTNAEESDVSEQLKDTEPSRPSTSNAVVDPSAAETPKPQATGPGAFPDGGTKAWLAVLGAWCCYFTGFGWISSIGVFQAYYSQHQLRDYSPSDVAWVLSVEVFMLQVMAPVFGKVFDSYGPRALVILGTFLHVFGLMMVSLSSHYYNIFLAQSICSGLGAAALYHSSTNAVSTWFLKRRALVLGLVATGSSLGGLILP